MGGGRWNPSEWSSYTKTKSYDTKSTKQVFSSRSMHPDLDPKGVEFRESRDSEDNPNSTAVIVALDVTGSMDSVSDSMARKGLNSLATNIYDRKPISDPHIMMMGIGDAEAGDSAPLQTTQFEADIRIAEQLEKIWLEGHGGGNHYESYALAWYFAAMHTQIDCFEKRGKKGYLFTIGDEYPTPYIRSQDIKRVLGYTPERDFTSEELYEMVSRQYHVFHLMVEEGWNMSRYKNETIEKWSNLLGQRAIRLADHTKMGEVIISTIQLLEGESQDTIVNSWDGDTSIVVKKAIQDITTDITGKSEVMEF